MEEENVKEEAIREDLLRVLDQGVFSLQFVAGLAGDRQLNADEEALLQELREERKRRLYVDLLFAVTHQYFPEEMAPSLWDEILQHKFEVSALLKRNVGITVAAVDYLTNIRKRIGSATVISERKITRIAEIAIKDGLTQLYDKSTFLGKLNVEIQRFERYGSQISLLMMDLDDFKQLNDRCGHEQGDRVLSEVAKLIVSTTRELDICARYGGEEFTVIFPQTGSWDAQVLAERIKERIARNFSPDQPVTISIGIATCPANATSAKALIEAADAALYVSKRNGKNQVTISAESATGRS